MLQVGWGLSGLWTGLTLALIVIASLLLRRWQGASVRASRMTGIRAETEFCWSETGDQCLVFFGDFFYELAQGGLVEFLFDARETSAKICWRAELTLDCVPEKVAP